MQGHPARGHAARRARVDAHTGAPQDTGAPQGRDLRGKDAHAARPRRGAGGATTGGAGCARTSCCSCAPAGVCVAIAMPSASYFWGSPILSTPSCRISSDWTKASFWFGSLGCAALLTLTVTMLLIIASCFAWMSSCSAGLLLTIAGRKCVPSDNWILQAHHRSERGQRGADGERGARARAPRGAERAQARRMRPARRTGNSCP